MTPSEEKIKSAWVALGKEATWNTEGWARFGSKQNSEFSEGLEEKQWLGYYFYRPKSLSKIEEHWNNWEENETLRQEFKDKTSLKLWAEKGDGDCGFSEEYVFWLEEIVLETIKR